MSKGIGICDTGRHLIGLPPSLRCYGGHGKVEDPGS
jgi:hypothetical protein